MEIRARYILIGLFTLAVIAGGFAFVYWLETAGGIGKRKTYEVKFSGPVSGLLAGSPVLFNGIRVGEVASLRLVPDQPRAVDATIAIDAAAPVRADTRVSIEFQGLTGYPVVTLTGGSPSAKLPEGPKPPILIADEAAGQSMTEAARQTLGRLDKLLAENSADVRTMISNLTSFAEALGRNSDKVDSILAGIERMTGGAGKNAGAAFDLTALPASAISLKPIGKHIAVPEPNALFATDTDKLLIQPESGEIAPLGTAKWTENLAKLLQTKIVQSFENCGLLGEVNRPIEGLVPDFELLTEIRRFWLTSTPELAATVEITAKLVTSEGQLAGAKLFQARVPVQSKDGAEAAKALDQAFHTVMLDILKWTQEKVAAAEPKKPGPKSHA